MKKLDPDPDPAWYSNNVKVKLTRALVRRLVPCPECDAPAGERCVGARGNKRTAMHQERWDLFREYRDRTGIH